ncbi:MAG: nuclear transport factor 2 family protein [Halobacteria archaeon]|nr:nuclear transport factor 2 family protein [Halobacteria archaeon]
MNEELEDRVRKYYTCLDRDLYDDLADILAQDMVHYRPDRTIEGRDTFISFMRDKRPLKDTTHEIESIYRKLGSADQEIAVRGSLKQGDDALFEFIDVVSFDQDRRIKSIYTFTR